MPTIDTKSRRYGRTASYRPAYVRPMRSASVSPPPPQQQGSTDLALFLHTVAQVYSQLPNIAKRMDIRRAQVDAEDLRC